MDGQSKGMVRPGQSAQVGAAVILIGRLAMAGGIGGGILEMSLELRAQAKGPAMKSTVLPTGMTEALVEFMQALASAPQRLAPTILGIFMVGWGATML